MVEVEVVGVGAALEDRQPVLVLQERHGERRCVPIWIGIVEAVALGQATADRATSRPLTHRLLLDVIAAVGAELTRVRITGIVTGQFHAELHLTWTRPWTGSTIVVSARASDAVILALHRHCSIHVAETVLEHAGMRGARIDSPSAQAPDTLAIEDRVEQLRVALTEATPKDFRRGASAPDTPDENPPGDDAG